MTQTGMTTSRKASPTILRDGRRIVDIDHYVPFLLNVLSNAWGRKTSAIYRCEFGIGLVEWRVIAMLNIEEGIPASRVCDVIRLDKAAVSRSLKRLSDRGFVRAGPGRKCLWWLSEAGLEAHDAILGVALSCEAGLVAGVSDADMDVLLRVMRQMLRNIDPAPAAQAPDEG